ncbi:MAG: hypothetical protein ACREYF_22410 [Gammaproteobacteria bacterium]
MTQLFVHPEVEDYFVEHDFRTAARPGGDAARKAIVDDFVDERLVLLRGLTFDADLSFVRSVTFHQKWKWKKLALTRFEAVSSKKRRTDPEIIEFVHDVFEDDWRRFDYFLTQSSKINQRISSALGQVFSSYRFSQRHIIWRFTETRVENLHFDVDRNCDGLELVRLYVNLDEVPRIWYTAGTFSTVASACYENLDLARFRDKPTDALLKRIDTGVFGDWNSRGRDKVARHLVLFEPGDVWLVDGRRVSHQVMYGRRVVSTLFVARPNGVPDPRKTFAQTVANIHMIHQGQSGQANVRSSLHPVTKRTPPPSPVAVDLRTAWEDLPDHVRQQTLIRL